MKYGVIRFEKYRTFDFPWIFFGSPGNDDIQKATFLDCIFRECFIWLSWNFLWAHILISCESQLLTTLYFSGLVLEPFGKLWIIQYGQNRIFQTTAVLHNSWLHLDRTLKFSLQLELPVTCLYRKIQLYTLFLWLQRVLWKIQFFI